MQETTSNGLTGLFNSQTAILCADCFGLPCTECGICNLIRALLLLPLRMTGLALLLVLSGLRDGSRLAAELQLMSTAGRGRAWKWLATAAASLTVTIPGSTVALPLGSIGLLAPQLGLAASVPVLVPVVIAGAATVATGVWIYRKYAK